MLRQPAVAGKFYESDPEALASSLDGMLATGASRVDAKAVLSPHAGLMYSGGVAGAVYSSIELPDTFVLVGPNHTGMGPPVSLMPEGSWRTPLGDLAIDEALASAVLAECPLITPDTEAHMLEHSLEVQLPFIARLRPDARIVPICIMSAGLDELLEVGSALARAVAAAGYPVVLVASTDMSHFVPEQDARRLDALAIERVAALDSAGLYGTVREHGISMCGYMPTVVVIEAARGLGATEARLVKYTTSGEASGQYGSVVGYAGIVLQ